MSVTAVSVDGSPDGFNCKAADVPSFGAAGLFICEIDTGPVSSYFDNRFSYFNCRLLTAAFFCARVVVFFA